MLGLVASRRPLQAVAADTLEQLGDLLPPGQSFSASGIYSLGIGFNWEIDVFGRLRRGVEAASAGLDASVEDYRDVLVVLMANVASNYLTVRTLQARIEYAESNVDAQRETLQLTQDRFNAQQIQHTPRCVDGAFCLRVGC